VLGFRGQVWQGHVGVSSLGRFLGASRARLLPVPLIVGVGVASVAAGCLSATLTDSRLTALGRTAVPLSGQSQSRQVDDAAACRERIMDDLVYVGAYTLYNPLATWDRQDALDARVERFARCLRDLGYRVDGAPIRRDGRE
jgi:hypothetical protein